MQAGGVYEKGIQANKINADEHPIRILSSYTQEDEAMKMNQLFTVVCFTSFLFLCNAAALADTETPAALPGGKIISADEAKKLLDQKGTTFIDTRKALNFGKGHIPGAVQQEYKGSSENVVGFDDSQDQFDIQQVVSDKNAAVVIYGHGVTGWRAYKAALKSVKLGYKNVLWFRGGLEEWEGKKYPVE
jgi:rhodanese-related sulfurtransferase